MKSRSNSGRQSIPTGVLERAQAAAVSTTAKKPEPVKTRAEATRRPANATRTKVIAALKKLHPMD